LAIGGFFVATTAPIILPIKTPGLNDLQKLQMRMKALEDTVEKLNKDLLKTATATKATGRAAATATGNIQRMGIALRTTLGPVVAIYGAFNFLNKSLQVASDRQVNVAKLSNGLRNLGGTQADLEGLVATADRLGKATLFDQEDFTQGFALLTSFQRIGVESYERVSKAAADLATVTGQDLKSAQIQLAKALEDPAKRVTDLARSGTVFTDQQKEQIEVLQESGRLFEAQSLILSEIEKQYGSAAEAAGSAGLAGAMDTLGEVTRDFQEQLVTGTDTINVAEEAILLLADSIKKAQQELENIQAIIGLVDGLLRDASDGAYGLRDAWDAMQAAIVDSVPGLWEAIQAYKVLAGIAKQYNANRKGGRNFGDDYASQEAALFEAAGGWTPYGKKTNSKTDPPPRTTTGGGGRSSGGSSSAASKAAREAEREAERVKDTLLSRSQLIERLEKQIEIQQAVGDLEKEAKQLELEILEINQNYDNLLRNETNELIRQNTERARALELDLARQQSMQSMMNTAGGEFADWFKQQPEHAAMFNDELTETEELLKGAYEIVSGNLTSGIQGLIDGTKEWSDILSDIAGQLGQMFLQAGFSALGNGLFPGLSFDGGGYTGGGSRAGGLDGKGGQLAMLHPQETVIDHTKGRDAMGRYEGNSQTSINYSPTIQSTVINGQEYVTVDQMNQAVSQGMKTAAKQGAAGGYSRTMSSLKNNRSSRKALGL